MSEAGVRRGRARWEWVPVFVVGAAAASTAELAAGLLLYSSEGFLRALTLVLAMELGALGLGLRFAPVAPDPVESVRRRWLFLLVTFTGAAAFSGAWALLEGFSGAPFSQGLGLAVLAGLPLYGVGALLAVLDRGRHAGGRPDRQEHAEGRPGRGPGGRESRVGAAAILGAAAGILVTGTVLVPRFQAPSVLLFWLVLLSGAALLHGWILDARTVVRSVERVPSPYGPVEVEHWQRGAARMECRVLSENGRVRGGEDADGRPVLAWEEGAAILARSRAGADGGSTAGFLLLGGGTGTLARLIRGIEPDARIVTVERNPEVSRAARRHLAEAATPGVELIHGDPLQEAGRLQGSFDLAFLDGAGVTPADPVPLLSPETLGGLRARLAPGGGLVVAPLPPPEDGNAASVEALLDRIAGVFPEAILYRGSATGGRAGVPGEDAGFLLLPRDPGDEWPERLGGLGATRARGSAAAPGGTSEPEPPESTGEVP